MAIQDFAGEEGFTVLVQSKSDLIEALDRLHTQVLDQFGEDSPMLAVLSDAMEALYRLPDHEVVEDLSATGHPRLTCVPCQQGCVRQPFLSEAGWENRCQAFRLQHPSNPITT